jgi:hypothetical protein
MITADTTTPPRRNRMPQLVATRRRWLVQRARAEQEAAHKQVLGPRSRKERRADRA